MTSHVVRFEPASMRADPNLLGAAELARRDRLVHAEDRAAYVAAHVLARECVAELLRLPVEQVRLEQTCAQCGRAGHGAPRVAGRRSIAVSLSHSSRHVAAIAAAHGAAGIDVETLGAGSVINAALTERERLWVGRQTDRPRAFRRLWVRKEALIKSGGAALDDAAGIDVLAETATGRLQPDDDACTEWSNPQAVGAWTVRTAG